MTRLLRPRLAVLLALLLLALGLGGRTASAARAPRALRTSAIVGTRTEVELDLGTGVARTSATVVRRDARLVSARVVPPVAASPAGSWWWVVRPTPALRVPGPVADWRPAAAPPRGAASPRAPPRD